jgi:hypothetical protein
MERLWDAMTPKKQTYVRHRLAGNTARKSALLTAQDLNETDSEPTHTKLTGWAQGLEKDPQITRYLALCTKTAVRRTVVTRNDVIQGLLDAVDAAATSTELTAAWRELGKVIDAYAPERVELTLTAEDLTRERLTKMSTTELVELTRQADGTYELPAGQDPDRELFEAFSGALEPPQPVQRDG